MILKELRQAEVDDIEPVSRKQLSKIRLWSVCEGARYLEPGKNVDSWAANHYRPRVQLPADAPGETSRFHLAKTGERSALAEFLAGPSLWLFGQTPPIANHFSPFTPPTLPSPPVRVVTP
jgi:hypothetical protein